jgi:endonuclease-8
VPEGDTIHRAARTLERAIGGRSVTRALGADGVATLTGHVVLRVEARGKHLLMRFDDGRTLHTHMRMEGRWDIYRRGDRWARSRERAVVVLETEEWIAVCFDAPLVELVRAGVEPELVRRLGPDLLDPDVDLDEALRRLRALGDLAIGEAILRQDAVSGIGNVYKSETLFLVRVSPFARVASLSDETLRAILDEARRLMKQNLSGRARVTRRRFGGSQLWVYGRSGKPCFECGEPIRMRRQGDAGRSTYYCARCQSA